MHPQPLARTDPPINRLPMEVLTRIFLYTIAAPTGDADWNTVTHATYGWLGVISLVCKHWHDVALNTSELWQRVDVCHSVKQLQLALSRSRNRPIDVGFHYAPIAKEGFELLMRANHTLRLRKLVLDWHGWEDGLPLAVTKQVCTLDLPVLEELCLDYYDIRKHGINGSARLVPLQAARLPRLHTLRTKSAFIPWDSVLFSQLRVLHFEEVYCRPRYMLSLDAFLAVLGRSQHVLEELTLAFSFPVRFSDSLQDATQPGSDRLLSLTKLRSLHLAWDNTWCTRSEVLQILEHMRLPPDASVTIVMEYDTLCSTDGHALLNIIPDDPSLFPLLRTVTNLRLPEPTAKKTRFIVSTEQGVSAEVSLLNTNRRWTYNINDQLPDFCTIFEGAPLRHLTIDAEGYTSAGLERAFHALQQIETIEVNYTTLEAVEQLLVALGSPDTLTPSQDPPVLPKLRRLWLKTLPWDPALLPNIEKVFEWRSKRGAELQELRIEVYGRPLDEDGESDLDMEHTTQIVALRMQVGSFVDYVDVPAPYDG